MLSIMVAAAFSFLLGVQGLPATLPPSLSISAVASWLSGQSSVLFCPFWFIICDPEQRIIRNDHKLNKMTPAIT
jgi:hypothetical protein